MRGRQWLRLQTRGALLPGTLELSVRVHGGRARVRPARVPQTAPQVHQSGAQWMLPRVQGG